MRPVSFPQVNRTYTRPASMTDEECEPLPAHVCMNHDAIISCWQPSWPERFALLFGYPLWVWITGNQQPPIALVTEDPFK